MDVKPTVGGKNYIQVHCRSFCPVLWQPWLQSITDVKAFQDDVHSDNSINAYIVDFILHWGPLAHPESLIHCLSCCFEFCLQDTQVEFFLPLSAWHAIPLWYLWSTQEVEKLPWEAPSLQHSRGTPWAGGSTEEWMEIPVFCPSGTTFWTRTLFLTGSAIIERLNWDI